MAQEYTAPSQSEDLFEDFIQHRAASTGQRFVNWLVDNLLMRFTLNFVTGTFAEVIIAFLFPRYFSNITYEQDDSWTNTQVIQVR